MPPPSLRMSLSTKCRASPLRSYVDYPQHLHAGFAPRGKQVNVARSNIMRLPCEGDRRRTPYNALVRVDIGVGGAKRRTTRSASAAMILAARCPLARRYYLSSRRIGHMQ